MAPSSETEIRDLRSLFWSDRDPTGRAFVPLADAFRRAGELGEALDLLSDGLGRHPDFSSGHVVAAWVHRDRDDVAAAEAAFRRALDLDPENARALHGLGQILARGGQVAAGRRLVLRAVELDPLTEWEEGGAPATPRTDLDDGEQEGDAEGALVRGDASGDAGLEREMAEEPVDIRSLAPDPVDGILGDPDGLGPIVEIAHLAPDAPTRARDDAEPEPSPFESWDEAAGEVASAAEAELPLVDIAALAPDAEPERPVPADPVAAEPEEDEPAPYDTRTMAELFARQGIHGRAVEIYRKLVRARPDDEPLAARLAELEALAGSGVEVAGEPEVDRADVAVGSEAAAATEAEATDAEGEHEVMAADDDESEEPSLREYLADLLAWKPHPPESS